ncbi:MAG TPA: hypothetical protein VGB70_11600 [Allosphingosinicella sp.]
MTLENEKAEQEIGIAKAKAIADAFPSSPTTGKTTLANDAGKIEASAMTATALNALARQIAADARQAAISPHFGDAEAPDDVAGCKILNLATTQEESTRQVKVEPVAKRGPVPVLLLAGEDKLTFAHWDKFRFTACRLHDDFKRANDAAATKLAIENGTATPRPGFEPDAGDSRSGNPLAAAGAIATVASKLLQFVTPDWDVSGINVTATDKALAASVAREIINAKNGGREPAPPVRVYWGGQVSKLGGSKPVFNALDEIDKVDRLASERIEAIGAKIKPHQDILDALAKKKPPLSNADEAKKTAATAAIAEWKKFSTPLSDAKVTYAALVKSLNGPDAEAALPINRVINEAAAARLLGVRGIALIVDVDNSGGSVQTRKSIVNLRGGGPPTWVSGGATVNFWAVRPADQQVLAAGQFTCLAGNVRLNNVAYHTNGDVDGCPRAKRK